jgi:hypothetical protein
VQTSPPRYASEARAAQHLAFGHLSCSGASTMSMSLPPHGPIEILAPAAGSLDERERRLIDAVVALARSLRDERDRLAARLREVEFELSRLASQLEARGGEALDPFSDPETDAPAARPRHPSRTSA